MTATIVIHYDQVDALKAHIDTKIERIVIAATRDAQRYAPIATGRLRSSIFYIRYGEGKYSIIATAPYAVFVELGTSRMAAQPYLRPALYQVRKIAKVAAA